MASLAPFLPAQVAQITERGPLNSFAFFAPAAKIAGLVRRPIEPGQVASRDTGFLLSVARCDASGFLQNDPREWVWELCSSPDGRIGAQHSPEKVAPSISVPKRARVLRVRPRFVFNFGVILNYPG